MKILLNKKTSKTSVNVNNSLAIDIKNSKRALPIDDLRTSLSEYDLYNYERKESSKIRLTLTINTICSNALFNPFTEIVKDEGSDSCICLNYSTSFQLPKDLNLRYKSVDYFTSVLDCIRDTQLSSTDNGFTYHCGKDIFNNHILRSKTFKSVCQYEKGDNPLFNTIADSQRELNGKNISGYTDTDSSNSSFSLYLYTTDDILSFKDCINERLIEENGWFGFINRSMFNTISGAPINRVINNRKACDFIDMYPTRDLFYFTPKYNPHRNRIEKNWNYTLTYPYSSTTNVEFISSDTKGLKVYHYSNNVKNKNGVNGLKLSSISKHGLKEGDIVNVYNKTDRILENAEVFSIIDEYTFYVFNNGLELEENSNEISFKQVKSYEEVEYYVRLFKKISDEELENHIGKLAFSRNIYNDEIAEVVYADDIDYFKILRDNLKRPLTSLYFTIVKNNAGNNEWYRGDAENEVIEYSHCFSDITCGFEYDKNMPSSLAIKGDIKNMYGSGNSLNGIITIDNDEFYGDLCSYSNSQVIETVIQPICYRFNTYQREKMTNGKVIQYDEITSDVYDVQNFKVNKGIINNQIEGCYEMSTDSKYREGYYYYPHHEIRVRTFSKTINEQKPIFLTIKNLIPLNDNEYEIYTYENHELSYGNVINLKIFDSKSNRNIYYDCEINDIISNKKFIMTVLDANNFVLHNGKKGTYKLLKRDPNIPSYATLTQYDSSIYKWRDIIENGYDNDSDIEKYPFTNGALYIHKNINLFVRRQDPEGYGGIKDADIESNIIDSVLENKFYNEEEIKC